MSRTIRKMLRYHDAPSVKWYKPGSWLFREAELKAGRPQVTTFQRYLKEKFIDKGWESVEKRRHYYDEYGKRVVYTFTDYIEVPVERTRKVKNLDFNQEEYDAFFDWRAVHKYVYRNKTCRRQRMNAVRHAKRAASRARRNEDRQIIQQELEFWRCDLAEDMV